MSRKIKYGKSVKIKAVEAVQEEHQGVNMVSNQLGVDRDCLQRWVTFYQKYGAAGLTPRASNTTYSKEFKLQVVRSIEEKGLSFKAASLKYNIPTPSTVRTWKKIARLSSRQKEKAVAIEELRPKHKLSLLLQHAPMARSSF